jgi:ABC-type uncharacterized transport system substrate-binding protein
MGVISLGALLYSSIAMAGSNTFRTAPTTNHGKKWRIGYYEGGPYVNYPANLKTIAQGLIKLGWIDDMRFNDAVDGTDSKVVWVALSKAKSDYLQFVRHAYSSANWDRKLRARNRKAAIDSLQNCQLDFMIAMGTWAGQDLANEQHSIPTMVVSTSDPVKSGIVKSAKESGFAHVHAKCDPERYIQQIRLFHDIFGFKRLGVVYENSVVGKTYAALTDIEYVAARRGFKLVVCEAPWAGVSQQMRTQKLIECHNMLVSQIDALFVTVHAGVDPNRMDEILARLIAEKIPTWSQRGPREVRDGVLMSISRGGFKAVGLYHAVIMARIFNGAKAGSLSQIFADPKKIAINLKTARAIGFKPPKGLLKVADEIYK